MENNSDCMPNDILNMLKLYYNHAKRYEGIINLVIILLDYKVDKLK